MFAWIKRLHCRIGWHSYRYDPVSFDGCSVHARCRWCRGVGKVDSQGNLFGVSAALDEITPGNVDNN